LPEKDCSTRGETTSLARHSPVENSPMVFLNRKNNRERTVF
jgi:hypothetical protein